MSAITPTLLLIIDGWGQAPLLENNALAHANTPTLDKLLACKTSSMLECSGRSVGLPQGLMGNSEVGHLNLGAGRIVYQDISRIDIAIEDGSFAENPVLLDLLKHAKDSKGMLHLMGLLSDGGVHAHTRHLFALIRLAKKHNVPVAIHAFMDGRDSPPTSGLDLLKTLLKQCDAHCHLASVSGRFYPMDRDQRWDRIEKYWQHIFCEKAELCQDPLSSIEAMYTQKIYDEFIPPFRVYERGEALFQEKDSLFLFNFRADRARQLAQALVLPHFTHFERGKVSLPARIASMTLYEEKVPLPHAFPQVSLKNTLGEYVSKQGLHQLRIAETEKYAHVTYFFNGGIEDAFLNEDRSLIPSPKEVSSYDQKPEMSVYELSEKLISAIHSKKYELIVCNIANLDMVGHTGNMEATIKACESVDTCLEQILAAVKQTKGRAIVTADHGNAEEMFNAEGPVTSHTTNPVFCAIIDDTSALKIKKSGKLGDIAPTILDLWELPIPSEMTGSSLLEKK